jgi:hypothetical protein
LLTPFTDREHPRADIGHIWNGATHPDSIGQDLIAHSVEYALLRELFFAPSDTESCEIKATKKSLCREPLSVFDADDASNLAVPENMVGWRFFEDQAGELCVVFPFVLVRTR